MDQINLKDLIKDVLNEGNILNESIKKHLPLSSTSVGRPTGTSHADRPSEPVVENSQATCEESDECSTTSRPIDALRLGLLENESFMKELTERVANTLLKNEGFQDMLAQSLKGKMQAQEVIEQKRMEKLERKIEQMEQYSRRNCLLLHGIHENDDHQKSTDTITKDFIWDQFGVEIFDNDIDRSHRLPARSYQNASNSHTGRKSNKPAPIIIKFQSHNLKNYIYSMKKKLKGSGFVITESLTHERYQCIKDLQKQRFQHKINSYWTRDGRIFYTVPNSSIVYKVQDFE